MISLLIAKDVDQGPLLHTTRVRTVNLRCTRRTQRHCTAGHLILASDANARNGRKGVAACREHPRARSRAENPKIMEKTTTCSPALRFAYYPLDKLFLHALLDLQSVLVIDTDNRSIVGDVPLSGRLESAAFSPSGDRLFGLSLWGDPMLRSYDWPKGSENSSRLVGPFNWDVLAVPMDSSDAVAQDYSLWVPRLLEGVLLILDPNDLSTRARLSLSFGIRAAHYEPRHHRVWLAAAYSGELWSISAAPPYDRVVFPLCGQTRDLTSDSKGRVIASSDCGVFRFDWTQ